MMGKYMEQVNYVIFFNLIRYRRNSKMLTVAIGKNIINPIKIYLVKITV